VVRTPEGLKKGLERLKEIGEIGLKEEGRGLAYAWETFNILEVARIVMNAIRKRRESRGPHLFFKKFEDNSPLARDDENWKKYLVINKKDNSLHLEARQPIDRRR
jgi:succinate dehydrogenase / fumarate reductase flavoprotein subunit